MRARPLSPLLRRRPLAAALALILLFLLAAAALPRPAAAQDPSRLLTGLSAEVTAQGVALSWTVDERRAARVTGFNCVYRTPGHLATGVGGAVPCEPLLSPAEARGRIVTGLPEYGAYDFEVVALETKDGPGIPWTLRALRLRVRVTEELAGPPGPERVVTGSGPLVEACRPLEMAEPRPWSLDEIVSAAHLTHYPGNGWTAGGDPEAAPDWPEPRSLTELILEAGVDPAPLQQALAGDGVDPEAVQRLLADERAQAAIAAVGAGTRALLRTGPAGGYELRLHSSYPFGDDYAFSPEHAVPGWADATHDTILPALWRRVDCPPANRPDATHDVALALSTDAGGGRQLEHSGYGWWTVAPVGLFPERIVATKGALSWGEPATAPPEAGTRWHGRAAGHLFWDERRWALSGEVELWVSAWSCAGPRLSGRIVNVVLASLDAETLTPSDAQPLRLPDVRLNSGRARDHASDQAWSGATVLSTNTNSTATEALAGFPAASAFSGDWLAAAYGPEADEVAGRLRLWTPLPPGADRSSEWPRQAVLVVGFGAMQRSGAAR